MKKQLASLFLVLVLAGSALAGVPLPLGGDECGMDNMMDMDCCTVALAQPLTPETASARLCCALECSQNRTTSPPSVTRVTPPSPPPPVLHPASTGTFPESTLRFRPHDRLHGPPIAGPVYLRNLALLI